MSIARPTDRVIRCLIHDFIVAVKQLGEEPLFIELKYHPEENLYDIWHDRADLEFRNPEFNKCVAALMKNYFWKNNIENVIFGYDHFEAKKRASVEQNNPIISNLPISISADYLLRAWDSWVKVVGNSVPADWINLESFTEKSNTALWNYTDKYPVKLELGKNGFDGAELYEVPAA